MSPRVLGSIQKMVATTAFGLSYDREKKNRQSGIVQYEIDIMRAVGGGEAATVDLHAGNVFFDVLGEEEKQRGRVVGGGEKEDHWFSTPTQP